MFVENLLTYSEASYWCQSESAHLASIHNNNTNKFINDNIQSKGIANAWWIGLYTAASECTHSQCCNRMTSFRALADGWTWENGDATNYFNWATGEPNGNGSEPVVEMYVNGGQWNDITAAAQNSFVCMAPQSK